MRACVCVLSVRGHTKVLADGERSLGGPKLQLALSASHCLLLYIMYHGFLQYQIPAFTVRRCIVPMYTWLLIVDVKRCVCLCARARVCVSVRVGVVLSRRLHVCAYACALLPAQLRPPTEEKRRSRRFDAPPSVTCGSCAPLRPRKW